MISLVCASSAIRMMSNSALDELLETSRAINKRLNITGMLLYKDGNFMQAPEGPDEKVLALYAKIESEFGAWTMAFCDFNQSAEDSSTGFSSFLCEPLDSSLFRVNPTNAHKLLLSLRKTIK